MLAYGCVKCQAWHYERDPLYRAHAMFQSKHGTRQATEAEWARARLAGHKEAK